MIEHLNLPADKPDAVKNILTSFNPSESLHDVEDVLLYFIAEKSEIVYHCHFNLQTNKR